MKLLVRVGPSPVAMASTADAHVQSARAYAMPRVHEASRRRSLAPDPLLLSMFPPATTPEASKASELCRGALAATLAAVEGGSYRPVPKSLVQPGEGTAIAIRGVAMDKLADDELLWLVHSMRKQAQRAAGVCQRIQIVDLGCGFGSRPWRLPLSSNVAWFDVDLPHVIKEKARLLAAAGAEVQPPEPHCDLRQPPAAAGHDGDGGGGGAGGGAAGAGLPLRAGSYQAVPCDMLGGDLVGRLQRHGWDPAQPTVWVCYAVIYYLPKEGVEALMRAVAAAAQAAPCAAFLGTIMNRAMVDLIQESAAQAAAHSKVPAAAGAGAAGAGAAGEQTAEPSQDKGSSSVSDEMRRSSGVQASATSIRFGVEGEVHAFLRGYGWETAEAVTPADVEAMYDLIGVAMQYPPELVERVTVRHGCEPACVVGVARHGF